MNNAKKWRKTIEWERLEISSRKLELSRECLGFPDGSVVRKKNKTNKTKKNPPMMQKTWVQSLSQEGPLEKEMATHSSTLA